MMSDVSNKTLAELVVLALMISVAGTIITLSQLGSAPTGDVTGTAQVNVTAVVAISLPVAAVDFGTLFQGATDNTTDSSPAPLIVQNDGGVLVNVSASGTPLFSGTGGGDNTASYQFKSRENPSETAAFNTGTSQLTLTNVTTATQLGFINELNFSDSKDTALVDLLIDIPFDESIGQKNSTLTFIAIQS